MVASTEYLTEYLRDCLKVPRFDRLVNGLDQLIRGVLITLEDIPHVDHFDRRLRQVCIDINTHLWSEVDESVLMEALSKVEKRYGKGWKLRFADINGPLITVRFEGNIAERKKRVKAMAKRYGHDLGPWQKGFRFSAECKNEGCTLVFFMKKGELGDIWSGELIDLPVQCPYHRK